MKMPTDSTIEAAFSSLRSRTSQSGAVDVAGDVMARIAGPRDLRFPLLLTLASVPFCVVMAFVSTRVIEARATPEQPPALAIFRCDGSTGNPFTLP